jgi:hypothetical protein
MIHLHEPKQDRAKTFRNKNLGTRLWKDVTKEDKRTLYIEFRSQDEFKDKLQ